MIQLAGYQVEDQLYHGQQCRVYRARDITSQQTVIIKTASSELPSTGDLTELKHDYDIGQQFNDTHIVRYLDLKPYEHNLALILEDFGAISLEEYLANHALSLSLFLEIATQLAESLMLIHDKNIIHKDIKPLNILINPNSNKIKITDFGLASKLQHETQQVVSPGQLEGTLPYISPEQTGRMNRAIDYRTDFYSLGITFYKMLTRELPFSADDAMELVHCHIAKPPKPPKMINADVPDTLSELTLVLLAKNAEERYQSARGIVLDLKKMQSMLQANSRIDYFKLRQQDVSGIFHIPQKLYGRERELDILMASFERVSKGPVEMILVSGYSGIGKSSLVQEVHLPIVGKRGYFISGKFDQFKRNEPYFALILAFQELIKHLLTETENQLVLWKEKLLRTLGLNGQVIIDVIPEMALIIGNQPSVEELDPTGTHNRFNAVFGNFIRVLASKEHPLVIFIDDLQWADSPSLDLIRDIMMNQELRHLLFLGAYRDNEVDQSHPLIATLKEIENIKGEILSLTLSPLRPEHLDQLIAETLQQEEADVVDLSKLVMGKTSGNPFFVNEFLNNLHWESLICFDSENLSWTWDVKEIESKDITGNVVDLMIKKIEKLPEDTRQALTLGACIGARFDLLTLALLTEGSVLDVGKSLWPAVESGIIIPDGNEHKLIAEMRGMDKATEKLNPIDRFRHDRVQQAAYALIPQEERMPIHLKIGRLLLEKYSKEELDEKLFYVTEQFNQSLSLITEPQETISLVELNIRAAIRAKESAAYGPAYGYVTIARDLLPTRSWKEQYQLVLSIYTESMELSFLTGKFDEMDQLFEVILKNATDVLDQVKAYGTKIHYHVSQNQMREGVEAGLEILEKLGVKISIGSGTAAMMMGVLKVKMAERNRDVEGFVNLPKLENPRLLATVRVLVMIVPPAYFTNTNVMALAACEGVYLAIKQGLCAEAQYHFSIYSFFITAGLGWVEYGYSYGKLTLAVMDRFNEKKNSVLAIPTHYHFMMPWKEPYRDGIAMLEQGALWSYDVGNFEYVAWDAWMGTNLMIMEGRPIPDLLESYEKYDHLLTKLRQEHGRILLRVNYQMLLNLAGKNENPLMLIGEKFDERGTIDELIANQQYLHAFCIHFSIAMLGQIMRRLDHALESFEYLEKNIDVALAMPFVPLFYLYRALIYCNAMPKAKPAEKKIYLRRIKDSLRKLKKFARHNPNNFANKRDLLLAEWSRVRGYNQEAMEYYERSIQAARDEGFLHEEALANELYGRFWLSQKRERIAKAFLTDAHYLYGRWGAVAKCAALVEEFEGFIEVRKITPIPIHGDTQPSSMSITITQDRQTPITLDLTTVLKASQTISSEIDLGNLLGRLITIIIENAGARFGHLLLEHEGHFLIEASAKSGSENIEVLQSTSLAESNTIAEDIIRYVMRSGEDVILKNACTDGMFNTALYINQNKSKSILCIPIRHHNKLQGLLYLENDEIEGVFTKERVELLRVLLSQAAISIVNARLYANLEDKVQERTAELQVANEELKAFSYSVSHDLRVPLRKIKGFSEILLEDYLPSLEVEAQRMLKKVIAGARSMEELIYGLLELSRMQQKEVERQTVDMSAMANEVMQDIRLNDSNRQVKVEIQADMQVQADPRMLQSVVQNLLNNAWKYSSKTEDAKVSFTSEEQNNQTVYAVKDNGAGFDMKDIDKLFGTFKRLHSEKEFIGTGVGLSTVKRVIDKHEGKIWAEAEKGKGAKFYFTLN